MLQFDPAREAGASRSGGAFILYMEGAGDRGILREWARRLLPSRSRRLFRSSVILGGRQPLRALTHFRRQGGLRAGARALCVLDRDDGSASRALSESEPGFELFTWSRRHIESYLLVPDAIRRALRLPADDRRIERVLRSHRLDVDDEDAVRDVDAKRLLGPGGVLPRALGRPLPLGRVARATREVELHADVHALFTRLRQEVDDVS